MRPETFCLLSGRGCCLTAVSQLGLSLGEQDLYGRSTLPSQSYGSTQREDGRRSSTSTEKSLYEERSADARRREALVLALFAEPWVSFISCAVRTIENNDQWSVRRKASLLYRAAQQSVVKRVPRQGSWNSGGPLCLLVSGAQSQPECLIQVIERRKESPCFEAWSWPSIEWKIQKKMKRLRAISGGGAWDSSSRTMLTNDNMPTFFARLT